MKHIFLFISLLFFWSCEKEVTDKTLSISEINIYSKGGIKSISISTNKSCRAESSEDWCIISPPSEGTEITIIPFELLPNESYDDRTCSIKVYVEEQLSHIVNVNQSKLGKEYLGTEYYLDSFLNLNSIQKDTITRMTIIGKLYKHDFDTLKNSMKKLDYLDLTNVKCTDNQFPKEAFGAYETENANKTIQTIILPKTINHIRQDAFKGCTGIRNIIIQEGVTNTGWSTFYGCTGLTSITIPNSVTNISYGTFLGCAGLTSITIPSSVNRISERAFEGCTGLINITIPNSINSIDNYAFKGCIGLTSITIPEGVTNIGWYTFQECEGLIDITIPSSVTSFGWLPFYRCANIKKIRFAHLTPLLDGYMVVPTSDVIIEVPLSAVEIYKSTYGWSFYTIIGY